MGVVISTKWIRFPRLPIISFCHFEGFSLGVINRKFNVNCRYLVILAFFYLGRVVSKEVTRDRIEKYLIAHHVKYGEQELMQLTRTLIDNTEEEARYYLKQLILHYRNSGEFGVGRICIEQHFEHLNSLSQMTIHKKNIAQRILPYAFLIFILIFCIAAIYKFIFSLQ